MKKYSKEIAGFLFFDLVSIKDGETAVRVFKGYVPRVTLARNSVVACGESVNDLYSTEEFFAEEMGSSCGMTIPGKNILTAIEIPVESLKAMLKATTSEHVTIYVMTSQPCTIVPGERVVVIGQNGIKPCGVLINATRGD